MKSIIDEVWEKLMNMEYIEKGHKAYNCLITKSEFEKAVEELLKLQREECAAKYTQSKIQSPSKIFDRILNAELK